MTEKGLGRFHAPDERDENHPLRAAHHQRRSMARITAVEPETCAFVYQDVSDGDTIKGEVSQETDSWIFGRTHVHRDERVRLAGVDCPERGEVGWAACRDWTRAWCQAHLAEGGTLTAYMREKYGRLYASVKSSDGADLVVDMLAAPELEPYLRTVSVEKQMEELAE